MVQKLSMLLTVIRHDHAEKLRTPNTRSPCSHVINAVLASKQGRNRLHGFALPAMLCVILFRHGSLEICPGHLLPGDLDLALLLLLLAGAVCKVRAPFTAGPCEPGCDPAGLFVLLLPSRSAVIGELDRQYYYRLYRLFIIAFQIIHHRYIK